MIAKDKILHIIVGFLISVIFSYIAYNLDLEYHQWYGVAAGLLIGIAKEAWDYYDYGIFSIWDLLSTLAGSFIGCLVVVLLV